MGSKELQRNSKVGELGWRSLSDLEEHQPKVYSFPRPAIKAHATEAYEKYEKDHGKMSNPNKIPHAIGHFYFIVHCPQPHIDDIMHLILLANKNCNGKLGFKEFKRILKILGGHAKKQYWDRNL